MKEKIAVIFGGMSCEHDVSIITGMQAVLALEKSSKYEVVPIYVTTSGEFLTSEILKDVSRIKEFKELSPKFKKVSFFAGDNHLWDITKKRIRKLYKISCALLATHGENGEDGSLQGLLKMCKIPQTSGSVLSQSVGMDKEVSKNMAVQCGANVLPFEKFSANQDISEILSKIDQKGDYPYVIKPNSLGSSIGVKLCENLPSLKDGLCLAFLFASEVLCERSAVDFCELNIACVKLDGKIICSEIEKPKVWHEILTFEDKYITKGKLKSANGLKRECPANISPQLKSEIEKTATVLYEKFKLSGIVRFDFIYENEILYFNEVNTIPGSLSNYLFASKFSFSELLEKVVAESIKNGQQLQKLEYYYSTSIF
ncbi:MAG: hypothetical protein R3Y32_07510 [Bacillota bacterium]